MGLCTRPQHLGVDLPVSGIHNHYFHFCQLVDFDLGPLAARGREQELLDFEACRS